MVTDIMDKEESIRNKLRNSGLEIISDIYNNTYWTDSKLKDILTKVSFIITLLDIASDLKMISSMNNNILKKEFNLFLNSLEQSIENLRENRNQNLEDLFKEREEKKSNLFEVTEAFPISHKGHTEQRINPNKNYNGQTSTNIGLQKGSTLLNALREIELSKNGDSKPVIKSKVSPKLNLKSNDKNIVNSSKSNRREEIVKIIKDAKDGLTITEIKVKARGELATMSDKTLQRELVSLVDSNVLYKTGEKRWSRYFTKS
jgi:flavodoxin